MLTSIILANVLPLSPAMPDGDPAPWVTPEDLQAARVPEGTTVFDLMIDPQGAPVKCVVIVTSGSRLDDAVCQALMRRSKFKPARDEQGLPSPGVFSDNVHWLPHRTGTTRYTLPPADLIVDMPLGLNAKSTTLKAAFTIQPDGSPGSCRVVKPSRSALLNEAACKMATATKRSPILDRAGVPVRGVRSLTVLFRREKK